MWRGKFEKAQQELEEARRTIDRQSMEIAELRERVREKEEREGRLRGKLLGWLSRAKQEQV
jgi:chromosome segregation ATPase